MTRPLRLEEATRIASDGIRLAARLAGSTTSLQVLADALDHAYPNKASTAPTTPTNQVDEDGTPIPPDTRPEALTLNPDRAQQQAATLLTNLRRWGREAERLLTELKTWDPDRPRRYCRLCGNPYGPTDVRCQNIIDGRQCAAAAETPRSCSNPICGKVMAAGEKLRAGRCNRCDVHYRRHDMEWPAKPSDAVASVDRIQLQHNVVIDNPTSQ